MMVVDSPTNSDVLSSNGASDPSATMMIIPQSREDRPVTGNSISTKSVKRNKKKSSSSHDSTSTVLSDSLKTSLAEELSKEGGQDSKSSKSASKSSSKSSSTSTLDEMAKEAAKEAAKKEKKSKKKTRSLTSLSILGFGSNDGANLSCDGSISNHRMARGNLRPKFTDSTTESSTKKSAVPPPGSGNSRSSVKSTATSKSETTSKSRDGSKKKKKKSSEKVVGPSKDIRKKSRSTSSSATRERRELSFASIHGRSIHKSNKRRNGISDSPEQFTRKLPPAVLSMSDRDDDVKKKSALKLKKEKQLLNQKPQREGEGLSTGESTTASNAKEGFIQNSLVMSSIDSGSNSSIDDSCSIVSDGSYSADDLLLGEGNAPEDPILPSSINHHNFSGSSFADSSFGDNSYFDKVEGSETTNYLNFDSHDSQNKSISISTILSSDTISPSLESSMSSFPEEDVDFSASPGNSSLPPSPKRTLLRNISSKLKRILPPLSQQQQQQQEQSVRQSQDSQVGANALSKSESNIVRIKLPGRNRIITRRMTIDFNEKVRVKRIPCQAQMIEEDEAGELWFQAEEYDVIKRKTMALIKAIQEENTGGVTYCTRGLERYFAIEEVAEKRHDAWDIVLDEQDRQRSIGCFDAERLSRAYERCTRTSYHEAVERGKQDEGAIARYMRKARQNFLQTTTTLSA